MANEKVKKPNRIAKFFRDYKSELKKITWSPFKSVKANTILVIVLVVVLSLAIALLDFGASQGFFAIRSLFHA